MFGRLPREIQAAARKDFRRFLDDPSHPSLRLHDLTETRRGNLKAGSRSVSVGRTYRAVYRIEGGGNVWYWIGTHSAYNTLTGRK